MAAFNVEQNVQNEIIEAEAQSTGGILIKLLVAAAFARLEEVDGKPSDDVLPRFIFTLLADAKRLCRSVS
jgi:hypothetical protein